MEIDNLIEMPEWKDIPEVYQYKAQNKNGAWYAYQTAPFLGIDKWLPEPYSPCILLFETHKENNHWIETLDKRTKYSK